MRYLHISTFCLILNLISSFLLAQNEPYLFRNFNDEGSLGSDPSKPVRLDSGIFFLADNGEGMKGLWKLDESNGLARFEKSTEARLIERYNQQLLFFKSQFNANSNNVVVSTIVNGEFVDLLDLRSALNIPSVLIQFTFGTTTRGVVFSIQHGNNLYSIAITDGTSNGTKILHTYELGSFPYFIEVFEEKFFFAHSDELWTSDGTYENTKLILKDNGWTAPENRTSEKHRSVYFNGVYYFVFYNDALGYEI